MRVRLLFLAAAACSVDPGTEPSGSTPPPGTDPPTSSEPTAEIDLQVVVPDAFDPLHGPLKAVAFTEGASTVRISVMQGGVVRAEYAASDAGGTHEVWWDGKDRQTGAWAPAGPIEVTATATLGVTTVDASVETWLVRAAFSEARLIDDSGVTSLRVPLYWAGDQELQDETEAFSTLAEVDDGLVPFDFPAVDLSSLVLRPDSAEPAAYRYGDQPILELMPADVSTALGPTGIDLVDVSVTAEGWINLSSAPLTADEPVLLLRESPLPLTLGVTAEDVVLTFWVGGTSLGEQRLPLHLYRLLDESQFDAPAERYAPWVAVVDPALTAIEGTTATLDAVLDALVDFVYLDLGLEYDTVAGASFYSTYQTGFFDGPHFFLSDFLARKDGNVVNCSDAANILGVYANMVGARLEHLIIEPGFDLNFIQAIGYSEFVSCPFGPGFCGFSYHAVTTYPDALQIWDATLALDGDADPGAAPHMELLVQSIEAGEYLDRLVRAGATEYGHQAQETIE